MGVSVNREEPVPSLAKRLGGWFCVFLGLLTISVTLGYGKARYDIHHCTGMADTPKCHRERAKEKAALYEQTKERQ